MTENGFRLRDTFLVFGAPRIEPDEIREVLDCLESGWLGTGPRVAAFERAFADYKGVSAAAAVNSCTAALHLSMVAAGLGPGDEVITTPLTFCATVNAIIHAGATPVLADIDPATLNIDPAKVAARITPRTRAILPVHFAGRPCAMDELGALAQQHGLLLIEDCAHAIETEFRGQKAGTFGDFGCFSFYVTKNITTGEGGMVVARSEEALGRIRTLGLHGMSKDAWKRFSDEGYKHYLVRDCGFKYNMTDMQASLGLRQLPKVETYWLRRQEIWDKYMQAFRDLPLGLPAAKEPDTRHGLHLFTLQIDEARAGISRDAFLNGMTARKIGVGVHYLSIPDHPYYQETLGWTADDFPNSRDVGRQTVSIPLSAKLTDEDVRDVIAAVEDILDSVSLGRSRPE
jgi:dTDP-4-amino-4,6-dideoxygalactose transaminase